MKKIILFSAAGIVPLILYMYYLNNKDEQDDDEKEVEEDFKVDDSKEFVTDSLPVGGKKESDDIEYLLSDTPSEEKEEPALEDRLYSTDLAEKLKIATSTARRRLASTKAVKLVHFDTNTNRPYILKSDFKKFKKLFEVKK